MQHYEHTYTSDLSASLSCSTVAPAQLRQFLPPAGRSVAGKSPANDGAGAPELGGSY